jgi:GNAT superfamily N-acetyltransferase
MIRIASDDETAELVRLINEAFVVEAFFKIGDRTDVHEITALIDAGGEFLVEDEVLPDGRHQIVGCLYLHCDDDRAYFGMLSIAPARQRQGLGRRLIEAAEARARGNGCRSMDLHIVDLRKELPDYYRRLGYEEQGTLPFPDEERTTLPCRFIVMSKRL